MNQFDKPLNQKDQEIKKRMEGRIKEEEEGRSLEPSSLDPKRIAITASPHDRSFGSRKKNLSEMDGDAVDDEVIDE